jgi:hypothetical protein
LVLPAVFVLVVTLGGCGDPDAPTGTVRGQLRLMNPTFKALTGEAPESWPMPGTVLVLDSAGDEVLREGVGTSGRFALSLPVGAYTLQSVGEDDFICDEHRVEVKAGRRAHIELVCPTI